MFQLRAGSADDVDRMTALDILCFNDVFRFSRAAMYRFVVGRNRHSFIAETASGAMAGFAIVSLHPKYDAANLVTLDVAPEWRRQGLAQVLMQAAEQCAAEDGLASMELQVHTANEAAVALYRGRGYIGETIDRDFYAPGYDAFVLRKQLPRR